MNLAPALGDGGLLWSWLQPDVAHRITTMIATKNLLFISSELPALFARTTAVPG